MIPKTKEKNIFFFFNFFFFVFLVAKKLNIGDFGYFSLGYFLSVLEWPFSRFFFAVSLAQNVAPILY